jgi:hypothetical protein
MKMASQSGIDAMAENTSQLVTVKQASPAVRALWHAAEQLEPANLSRMDIDLVARTRRQIDRIITAWHSSRLSEGSPEAFALWKAAVELEDAGPRGLDIGLMRLVRDKINAMLGDKA